jgi:uncharacterized protein YbjT (DUF2867 family)
MDDRKIFVAGATGFTGRAIVRLARERNLETIAHVRPDSSELDRWRERFGRLGAEVDTTAWEEGAMASMLEARRPDILFCAIGTTRARMRESDESSEASYEAVDYGLTHLLLEACRQAGLAPRFVYVSAMGVGPDKPGAYYRQRWRAECEVREAPFEHTVVRPGFIAGDRDESRTMESIGAAIVDGAVEALGALGADRIRDRYHSFDNDELAEAMLRAALDPACANTVLEAEDLRALL